MKKIIYFSLLILLLVGLGCAGRSSAVHKTKKQTETSLQEESKTTQKTEQKKDSTGSKKTTAQEQGSTKASSAGWKYTAPATDSPCLNTEIIKPVFIRTASGDSIDVSLLPRGAVLESQNSSSESNYSNLMTIDEQARMIADLKQDLNAEKMRKLKEKIVNVEKLKEVEKQTIQWYLVGAALLLGLFLPNIFKWAATLLKKSIKPI